MDKPISDYFSDDRISYFQSGYLVNLHPQNSNINLYDNRGVAYSSTIIVSDGSKFSLKDPESIAMIPVPNFNSSGDNAVFSLDYVLHMIAGSLRNAGENTLSICVERKATEMMPNSGLIWKKKDYFRLALWLYEDGQFSEGDLAEKSARYITANTAVDTTVYAIEKLQTLINESDLVAFSQYSGICCEECAKYAGRVYRTHRFAPQYMHFPMMPKQYVRCGFYHAGCDVGISRYWAEFDSTVYVKGKRENIAIAMQRPYLDNRTTKEKETYAVKVDAIKNADAKFEEYIRNKKNYSLVKCYLPALAPRSYSAYVRMKNSHSPKFCILVEAAEKYGIKL